MAQPITVRLSRYDAQPWGFRLQGGKDFGTPLIVQKVNSGSLADQVGLVAGDAVISINGQDVFDLRHKDAQDVVVRAGNNFEITVQRGGSTWKPSVTATGNLPFPNQHGGVTPVTKTSLAYKGPESRPIGTGYNNAARPFNSPGGHVKSIVNNQYNSPVGIYSDESIAETLSAQAEVLAGGVLGVNFKKNEKIYNAANSEVFKMLQEQANEPDEPVGEMLYKDTSGRNTPRSPMLRAYYAPNQTHVLSESSSMHTEQHHQSIQQSYQQKTFEQSYQQEMHQQQQQQTIAETSKSIEQSFESHAQTSNSLNQTIEEGQKLGATTISAALNARSAPTMGTNSPSIIAPTNNVNNSFATPKPFNYSQPPAAAPKSPSSYPPSAPSWAQPKPTPSYGSGPTYDTNSFPRQNGQDNLEERNDTPTRTFTPSLINKPAPTIPYYQKNLCPVECNPTESHVFDPKSRSPSPHPGRSKSPAPGPGPNPLRAMCPKIKDPIKKEELIDTVTKKSHDHLIGEEKKSSLIGFNTNPQNFEITDKSFKKSFYETPDIVHQTQIGNLSIQEKSKESQLNEQNRSEMQSVTTQNIGNMQVQRRKRVVEEFEHSKSEKSVEILKTSGNLKSVAFESNKKQSDFEEKTQIAQQTQEIGTHKNLFPLKPEISKDMDHFPKESYLPDYVKREENLPPIPVRSTLIPQVPILPPNFKSIITGTNPIATTAFNAKENELTMHKNLNESSKLTNSKFDNQSTSVSAPLYKQSVSTANKYDKNSQPANNPNPISNSGFKKPQNIPNAVVSDPSPASAGSAKGGAYGSTSAPRRGRGIMNKAVGPGVRIPLCGCCNQQIRGPFITALGRIWCPDHFICTTANCRRPLHDIGFVEEKGQLYCEFCFEKYFAPSCSKCAAKIMGDCLNAIGKHYHPECFTCAYCGKLFGNSPFFLEEGEPYCQADWNEMFTTKCFACGFPVEAGDRWVEALNNNYHSQCFNCSACKKNLEGQSFFAKGGRPYCKNHAR